MPNVPVVVTRGQWEGSGSYWVSGADVTSFPGSLTRDPLTAYCVGPERLVDISFPVTQSGAQYAWRITWDDDQGQFVIGRESGSGWYSYDSDDAEQNNNYKFVYFGDDPTSIDFYIDNIGYTYAVGTTLNGDAWLYTNASLITQTGSFDEDSGYVPPGIISETAIYLGKGTSPRIAGG